MGCGPKLAARFVRDVTIFDGTQVAPSTPFTKIWRLKNVGEVPWPPGTKMLFVGGDQMTSEMAVPLSRGSAVMPGEEVDVAVEMVAPKEHGRYLGYWRLTGPMMRRKFGQRVWCHVQVVDPSQPNEGFDEGLIAAEMAEIEKKKGDLAAKEEADPDDVDTPDMTTTTKEAPPAAAAAGASAMAAAAASGVATTVATSTAVASPVADVSDPSNTTDPSKMVASRTMACSSPPPT